MIMINALLNWFFCRECSLFFIRYVEENERIQMIKLLILLKMCQKQITLYLTTQKTIWPLMQEFECLSRKISGMFYQYILINWWHTFNVLTNTSLKDDMQMEEESCSGKQVFLIKSINRKSFEMLKLETRIMINTNKYSNSLYKFF